MKLLALSRWVFLGFGSLACATATTIDDSGAGGDTGLGSGGTPSSGSGGLASGGVFGTGGVIATGGSLSTGGVFGTGGVIATGGSLSTGGSLASGGTTSTGGSSSTGGAASTGGASSVADCAEGTITAVATPDVLAWETATGAGSASTTTGASGAITIASGATADPYVSAILSHWAASGRECVDVSAFTGVEFDLSGTASPIYLKAGMSKADAAGSCTAGSACYANPQTTVTPGTNVRVAFSSFVAPGWGVNASFDATELINFIWVTQDHTAGHTISVTNISFY
jgi:hypothetical protein